ncbi:MAG: NADP-dependent isocitrate dehydrogenase, partial [Candidatus Sedimenticola sp. 6PFRAG1]
LYWAKALAAQGEDSELQASFTPVAEQLAENESEIVDELISVQGQAMEIGGYFRPDRELTSRVMRPSSTLNAILDSM